MLAEHVEQFQQPLPNLFALVAAAGPDEIDEPGQTVLDVAARHEQVGDLVPGLPAHVAFLDATLQIRLVDGGQPAGEVHLRQPALGVGVVGRLVQPRPELGSRAVQVTGFERLVGRLDSRVERRPGRHALGAFTLRLRRAGAPPPRASATIWSIQPRT